MIKGFEDITKELSDYEAYKIKPRIIEMLKAARGRRCCVTNKEIIEQLKKEGLQVGAPRVRGIIHYIRVHDEVKLVIATSDGYYVAEADDEIDDYLNSLTSRITAIRSVQAAIRRQQGASQQTGDLFAEVRRG